MTNPSLLRIRESERILFTKRLSLYLRAGIPILEALSLLHADARGANAVLLTSVITDIRRGISLSAALTPFRRAYKAFHVQLISIGETSGSLPHTLMYLTELMAKQSALSRKLISALIYPAIIAIGTIGISLFLVLYTFPKISPLFRGLHTQLPFTTRVLLHISNFATQHGAEALFVGVVFIFLSIYSVRIKAVRTCTDSFLLRLPILGSVLKKYCLARMFHSFTLLLKSGVRVTVAFSFVEKSISNTAYQASLTAIEKSINTGGNLATAFRMFPSLYPSVLTQLIAAGEMTGTLTESMQSISDLYEQSLEEELEACTALVEPVLMISMGLVVGFVALAIISPMYALTQNLSGQ